MGMILTRRYNVDRFGYLIPHRYGNLPMVGAVATYRPGEGRFGGAVAVEEGTTNLWSGTSDKTRTWRRYSGGNWITFVSDNEILVDFFVESSGDSLLYCPSLDGVSEGPYTFSVEYEVYEFHTTASKSNGFYLYIHDASGNMVGRSEVLQPKPGERGRLHVTVNNPAENTSFPRVAVSWGASMAAGDRVRMRVFNFQIEAKPFATSFVDGTRAAARLEYPTSLLTGSWTLSTWLKRNYTGLYQGVAGFGSEGDSDHLYWILNYSGLICWGLRVDGTRFFQLSWGDDPHINDTENWHHHVIQVDNDALKARYFLDGVLFGEKALSSPVPPITKPQSFGLGRYYRSSGIKSILFDELLILPYAASEEEILSWYEAQGPLPPHPQALLQWDWQAVRPATMVVL
jgi:hypothetical protein